MFSVCIVALWIIVRLRIHHHNRRMMVLPGYGLFLVFISCHHAVRMRIVTGHGGFFECVQLNNTQ